MLTPHVEVLLESQVNLRPPCMQKKSRPQGPKSVRRRHRSGSSAGSVGEAWQAQLFDSWASFANVIRAVSFAGEPNLAVNLLPANMPASKTQVTSSPQVRVCQMARNWCRDCTSKAGHAAWALRAFMSCSITVISPRYSPPLV